MEFGQSAFKPRISKLNELSCTWEVNDIPVHQQSCGAPLVVFLRSEISVPRPSSAKRSPQPTTSQKKKNSRKEQHLNRHRQPHMCQQHRNHNTPTRPLLHHTDHRPQVPDQEPRTHHQAHADKHPVQHRDRTPADQRHRDPDNVAVPVQRPALHETDPFARGTRRTARRAVPPQQPPQDDRDEEGIPVDQTRGAAQEAEVVGEVLFAVVGEVLADGAGEEEDEDDGGGDPEGAVEVRVAFEGVEKGGARVEGGGAAGEHGAGVDVEKLGVEGEGPEVAF